MEKTGEDVECVNWIRGSDPESHGCKIKVLDNPTVGFCNYVCEKKSTTPAVTSLTANSLPIPHITASYLLRKYGSSIRKGVSGNIRAVVGINRVPLNVLEERNKICRTCPYGEKLVGGFVSRCTKCGCVLWSKMRLADQECPEKFWLKHEPGTGDTSGEKS
jgi:hypothetical protein